MVPFNSVEDLSLTFVLSNVSRHFLSHRRLNFQNKGEGTGFETKFRISHHFHPSPSERKEKSILVNTMFTFLSTCFKSKVKGVVLTLQMLLLSIEL